MGTDFPIFTFLAEKARKAPIPHIIIDDKSDEEVKRCIDKIRVLEKDVGRSLKFSDLTRDELLVWG